MDINLFIKRFPNRVNQTISLKWRQELPRLVDDIVEAFDVDRDRIRVDMDKAESLGLTIASLLVGQIRGKLEYESAPGRGTEFRLVFPGA